MMKRVLVPVLSVFFVMSVSYAGYFGSRHLSGGPVQLWMAAVFGTTYFISIAFGALYVFTVSHVRGAGIFACIMASLINPFIWMTKEVLRITESHPFLQSLYWYFNPLDIWLISFVVMEMGMATLLARVIRRRSDRSVRIFTMAPVVVIIASLAFGVGIYAWGEGENVYSLFLEGYRGLFGYGI